MGTGAHPGVRVLQAAGPTVTLTQAAQVLGISRAHAYALAKRGAATTRLPLSPRESRRHHASGSSIGSPSGRRGEVAEWAAKYAAAILPVLPLHSIRDGRCTCRTDCGRNAGKHPLTAHGKDDATTDLRQVAEWRQRWPHANVGIRPPAGVMVLDIDPRNGGATALLDLTREHGDLPQTLTARTGSGGLHVWLSYAGPTRGQLCRGVDIKTSSGYVVTPPSLHASGRRYEWLNDLPTAPAPRWIRRLLNPPPPPSLPRPAPGGKIDHLVRYVSEAPDGELNMRLYWASCRAHEAGLDTGALVDAAIAKGHPQRGARNTAESAAKAPGKAGVVSW